MRLNDIYDLMSSSKEKYEKIEELKKYLNKLDLLLESLDRHIDIGIRFQNEKKVKQLIDIKYLNKDIKKININILLNSLLMFLSPNKNTESLIKKYSDKTNNFKFNTNELREFLEIPEETEKIVHKIIKEDLEPLKDNELVVSAIYNPSFKILRYISSFKIVDHVDIYVKRSDIIEENEVELIDLTENQEYKNAKLLETGNNDNVIIEGPLKMFYEYMDYKIKHNVYIKITLKKDIITENKGKKIKIKVKQLQKIKLMKFCEKHGLLLVTSNSDLLVDAVPVNSYELFALIS